MVRQRFDAASVSLTSNPRKRSCSARLAPGGILPGGGGAGGSGDSGTGTSGGGRCRCPLVSVALPGTTSPGCFKSHSSPSWTVSACFTAASTASVLKPIFASSIAMECFRPGTWSSRSSAMGGAAPASSRRRSVSGETSLGVGLPSTSPLLSSSFSLAVRSLANFLPGAKFSCNRLLFFILSTRKSAASSKNHVGRTPLCPPSNTRSTRSPAHALWRSCVWCGSTKVSSDATPKKAGHTALGAHLIGVNSSGSNAARVVTSVRIISSAQLRRNCGTGNLPRLTNSSATVRRSRNAESRTQAARSWSSAARRMEVVAPMDRPQSPIAVTVSRLRRCWSTTRKSFSS
mmetsp:Transcript_25433/g.72903  ORF Transcript_25433/g.72903 Transcript_25433/m.72903 type:complete len:345 (+) Transcript_25433:195-1229(+)